MVPNPPNHTPTHGSHNLSYLYLHPLPLSLGPVPNSRPEKIYRYSKITRLNLKRELLRLLASDKFYWDLPLPPGAKSTGHRQQRKGSEMGSLSSKIKARRGGKGEKAKELELDGDNEVAVNDFGAGGGGVEGKTDTDGMKVQEETVNVAVN